MKKALTILILGGSFCFSSLAQTIIIGTEASYPLFEYYDKENKLVGFDIDIAQKICELSQLQCQFRNQSFDSLIPSLKTKRIDAAIAGIDITAIRSEQVLFTLPYYQNSAQFIAKKETFSTINELNNRRIGVQNGTTHQKYLMENYPDMQIVSYDSYQNAIIDLKSKRIDAIFIDTAVGNEWLTFNDSLVVVGNPVSDPDYFGTGFAIAVRQDNDELAEQFNKAIKRMYDDGSYQQIYDKWFSNK